MVEPQSSTQHFYCLRAVARNDGDLAHECREALGEIERLTRELKELDSLYSYECSQVTRLRAALREIADYEYGQQAQIAREALRGAETDFKPDKVAVSIPAETKAGYAEFISDAELTSRRLRGAVKTDETIATHVRPEDPVPMCRHPVGFRRIDGDGNPWCGCCGAAVKTEGGL